MTLRIVLSTSDVFGSDCKILGMDDNKQVILTFTRPHHPGARSVTLFGELLGLPEAFDPVSPVALRIDDIIDVILDIPKQPFIGELDQINWVPFEYNKQLLYIPYLWPLTVLDMVIDKRRSVWHAHAAPVDNQTLFERDMTVANSIHVLTGETGAVTDRAASMDTRCPWQHGRVRGSTPALQLPSGQYLGVFHAYDQLHSDQLTSTYLIGAYTFRAGMNNIIQLIMCCLYH